MLHKNALLYLFFRQKPGLESINTAPAWEDQFFLFGTDMQSSEAEIVISHFWGLGMSFRDQTIYIQSAQRYLRPNAFLELAWGQNDTVLQSHIFKDQIGFFFIIVVVSFSCRVGWGIQWGTSSSSWSGKRMI